MRINFEMEENKRSRNSDIEKKEEKEIDPRFRVTDL